VVTEAKVSRVNAAYDLLRAEILENRMPSGYQAPEPEIAARLGMSRTPVREALLRLQADGLIELVPRRGARVVPISMEDMREIYEILFALEPEAAAKLAESSEKDQAFPALDAATSDMERALAAGDLDQWAEADDRFHRTLLASQDNKRMAAFVTNLFDQSHRVRMVTLRLREPPFRSTQEHREILDHIMAGRSDRAREIFRSHRRRAAAELLKLLRDYKFHTL